MDSGYIHMLLDELCIHVPLLGIFMPYWNTKNVKRWEVSWAEQDLATDTVLGFISCFQMQ